MSHLPVPIGRFAPSPTGRLHLGNARTALLAYLQIRARGGSFLLRIEDLDGARARQELTVGLLRDLDYLGLHWDRTPIYQSQRREAYQAALDALTRGDRLFPCFCSRADVARAASAPQGAEGQRYPGTCAGGVSGPSPSERPPSLRFRVDRGETGFTDRVAGFIAQDVLSQVGHFVVQRGDGVASYQLVVVVDDAESGVTEVLRGDDLLDSTPRQIQLYRALGLTPPQYSHVPLLVGTDGKRLAKREGAFAVTELREAGVPAERVIGLLAQWSGLGDGAPIAIEQLIPRFSLDGIPREPVQTSELEIREALIGSSGRS